MGKVKAWENIRSKDGARHYIVKYVTKSYQKVPPAWFENPGRFWGKSKDSPMEQPQVIDVTEGSARNIIAAVNSKVAKWDVLPSVVVRFDKPDDTIYTH